MHVDRVKPFGGKLEKNKIWIQGWMQIKGGG
jgi:hypothetical protein